MTAQTIAANALVERLQGLLKKGTKGPWAYRPDKHDDWGWIRGPEVASTIGRIRPPVAIAREGYPFSTSEDDAEHRRAGTDPYYANAALIVAAVNALPDLLATITCLTDELAGLADPSVVHLNMLRGGIAKPSVANIWHLYRAELLDGMPVEYHDAARALLGGRE